MVETGNKLCDLLLCHGRSKIDVPSRQTGKRLRVAREQAMQEGGAAAQVPQDEQWLFNRLAFITGEKDIIQKEAEPVDKLSNRPDGIKQEKKNDSLACEASRGVL